MEDWEDWNLLEKLIAAYDDVYGEGTGHEIATSLMHSHDISDIVKVFEKARGRKIIIETPQDMIDAVIVKYLGKRK